MSQEEAEKSALERIQEALLDGKPARSVALTDLDKEVVKHLCLLTMKPMIYVANVAETDLAEPEKNSYVEQVKGLCSDLQSGHVVVSAQVRSIVYLLLTTSCDFMPVFYLNKSSIRGSRSSLS